MHAMLAVLTCLLAIGGCLGASCEQPNVQSSVYTAADAHFSNHGLVSATFSIECKNKVKNPEIFAVFRGQAVPVAQDLDSSKYQVTFSESNEKSYLPAGQYKIDLYDEDGYALYRKAQRGESKSEAAPIAAIEFEYPRVRHSLLVHSETVAVLLLLGVAFYAYSARKRILG